MKAFTADEIKVITGRFILANGYPLLMFGISVPSHATPAGMASRAALSGKVKESGTVSVNIIKDRRKTRTQDMCELFTPNGENINCWMVTSGFAKAYIGDNRNVLDM